MYELIGFKEVDYVNKLGNRVQGYYLYLVQERKNVNGLFAKEEYIKAKVDYIPELHDTIELSYDEFQNVNYVRRIEN